MLTFCDKNNRFSGQLRNCLKTIGMGLGLVRLQMDAGLTEEARTTLASLQDDFQPLLHAVDSPMESTNSYAGMNADWGFGKRFCDPPWSFGTGQQRHRPLRGRISSLLDPFPGCGPEIDRAIVECGCKGLAVGRKGHGIYAGSKTLQGKQLVSSGRVPKSNRLVQASRGHRAAIG